MKFKPMLADTIKDVNQLRFPVFASPKLDGIRAMVQNGVLVSRNLKLIPSARVQETFKGLPEGLDGELIYGDPTATDAFRQTTHVVMSRSAVAANVTYYVFDIFTSDGFQQRYELLKDILSGIRTPVKLVKQIRFNDARTLLDYETEQLELGYEGLIVRSPLSAPYKQGRATLSQGWLLKLKRFEDSEAVILDVCELMHNDNVATTNALGRTERSSHLANMRPGNTMGKLVVRDLETKVEFEVGSGYDAATREEFWRNRNQLKGQVIKYKHFPIGVLDKPRFPIFLGLRAEGDRS